MNRAAWLLVVVSIAIACSVPLRDDRRPSATPAVPNATSASIDPTLALRRPTPPFGSGETRRPSNGRDASAVPGAVGFQPGGYVAFGTGPIFPSFLPRGGDESAVLNFFELAEPSWPGAPVGLRFTKVRWIAAPGFHGVCLSVVFLDRHDLLSAITRNLQHQRCSSPCQVTLAAMCTSVHRVATSSRSTGHSSATGSLSTCADSDISDDVRRQGRFASGTARSTCCAARREARCAQSAGGLFVPSPFINASEKCSPIACMKYLSLTEKDTD